MTADRIGVAVNDGAVSLSGQVVTYPEKEAAVAAALRVTGVRVVADEIVVQSEWGDRADIDIAHEAGAAFEHLASLPPESVDASVHNRVVTLSGAVDWNFQREAARHAVSGIRGVHGVRNTIVLKPSVAVSPAQAKTKIAAAFSRTAALVAQHVTVTVAGTEVKLAGTVSSWAERRQAEDAAWSTPGVTHINDQLRVTS